MNGPLKMDLNPLLVTCTFGKCLDPMGIVLAFHYVFHQETDDASMPELRATRTINMASIVWLQKMQLKIWRLLINFGDLVIRAGHD